MRFERERANVRGAQTKPARTPDERKSETTRPSATQKTPNLLFAQ
jgi:hypothetical protein